MNTPNTSGPDPIPAVPHRPFDQHGQVDNAATESLLEVPAVKVETAELARSVVAELAARYQDAADERPWVVAFSGGKDSTLVAHLVCEAIKRVRPSRRTRPVLILSSDTQVETPAIEQFVAEQLDAIQTGSRAVNLPITSHLVRPELHETFWVRLIGYGYAAPTRNFRWCTDRLKIRPSNTFLRQLISRHGGALVLTGSRFAESGARAASLRKHTAQSVVNPHSTIKGAYLWPVIRHFTTEQVWEYLALTPAPWGGHHRRLQNLYKEANSGECAVALDETTQPCGNSRFGCWTCTVVKRDKSIEGFIGSGHDDYAGLAAFRDWLCELRDNPKRYREPIRRNGRPGNGPLTLDVRAQVLDRLLDLQADVGHQLISPEEIAVIKQVWISDRLIDPPELPQIDDPHDAGHTDEETRRSVVVDLPMPTIGAVGRTAGEDRRR
ncbi:DNA phosphorothioation system sulfurtransferase DndC [Amycolatopsis anabasis]|uniref:DNA phosphorothioation system sulfurtransferase DndC n=1 Tax=Amycolatopsis anabasis TaxID=1840409 RepID=UPI00131B92B6|nr:DNA phosphorothioation system sulfurtransferase DndC [Amycolatopsis anabasis]